jgi:uncharacterized membrane protein
MSEQTQTNNTLVIALVVIAVLLAAIVGVIIYRQNTAVPAVTATAPATTPAPAEGSASGAMGGGMGGATGGTSTPAEVDPATATKVPNGTDPAEYVNAYYEACAKGDWQAAYDMLPADKKAGNSPDALKEQVSGYGIESFTVSKAEIKGDSASVNAEQVTGQYGTFVNTWTFTKDGETWLVASKAVTGMK